MSDVLNSKRVEEMFLYCMFRGEEPKETYLPAPGITTNVGFHPGRIAERRNDITVMLAELPKVFMEEAVGGGGGCSFLAACYDKNGDLWTSFHRSMEQLFQLGIAAGVVSCLVPREMWALIPGGMPYYVVHAVPKAVEEVPIPA